MERQLIRHKRLPIAVIYAAILLGVCQLFPALTGLSARADEHFLPPLMDTAFSEAEAQPDLCLSFTMEFRWKDHPPIVERFDGNTRKWILISGDRDSLPRQARAKLRRYKSLESAPGGLSYGDYREHLSDVEQTGIRDGELIYSFSSPSLPNDLNRDEMPVETRLVIDEALGGMREYAIIVERPFKPNVFTSLKSFHFIQTFDRVFDDVPPVLKRFEWRSEGKSLVGKIDEQFTLEFSQFEKIMPH